MNSASEIMRDTIVKDILPILKDKMYEAYDTHDFVRYNYLTKCISHIEEAVDIGERNDVGSQVRRNIGSE